MRILLVNTNSFRYLSPPPLGLAYLSAALKEHGHQPHLLDLMFEKHPERALNAALDDVDPSLVGFSIRNLDNQSMLVLRNPLPAVRGLVALARARGVTTVLGGTAFTTMPVEMLEYMEADYGIAGEGETGLPQLADDLTRDGRASADVAGLVWRDRSTIRARPAVITGYGGARRADFAAIDWRRYRRTHCPPAPGIVIKTGCPYSCAYCDARSTMGSHFRPRDPQAIIEDIRRLRRSHKVRSFFLIDHCFNSPLDHAKAVLAEIIRGRLNIGFATTVGPVTGCYDDEFFRLFRRAGGTFAILDADSLSATMLERYRKPFTVDDVSSCARLAHRNRLPIAVSMLFGGPGETEETVRETMSQLRKLDFAHFMYAIGVRVLPGTGVYEAALREGVVRDRRDLLMPTFYVSRELDIEWARAYVAREASQFPRRDLRMLASRVRHILRQHVWSGL
jgi:radical SAM superfamily enzyme YgiQ (UPF0313 family)